MTNQSSFDNIRKWISDIHSYAENNVNIVLIGNKCDLTDKKVIDTEKGKELAKEYNIQFFECSAKNDINVNEAFTSLVKQVTDRIFVSNDATSSTSNNSKDPSKVSLGDNAEKPSKGCC